MRINRCSIKAFGHFKNEEFTDLDHPFVVVHGANEAGKSTFFQFMRSMLYGFENTDPQQLLYAPKDGAAIEGEMRLKMDDRTDIVVTRSFDEQPRGHLLNGVRDTLGNNMLPFIAHIPRSVFESVYTLGLYDLVQFSGDTWEQIQDRLLGGLSMKHIRPAREVLLALEKEAGTLWQGELQSQSQASRLEVRERELQKRAQQTRQKEERLRRQMADLEVLERKVAELEEEQIVIKAERRRIRRLLPVHRLIDKIDTLDARAGNIAPFKSIPEDPRAMIDTLNEQINNERAQLDYARRDIRFARDQVQKVASDVLTRPLSKDIIEAVRNFPEIEFRQHVYACQEALGSLREVKMYAKMLAVRVSIGKSLIPWIIAIIAAALFIVYGIMEDSPILWVGAGLFVFAGLKAFEVAVHNRNVGLDEGEEMPVVDDFEVEAEEHRAAISELLRSIPVPAVRLANPDLELVSDMENLRSALLEYDEHVHRTHELEQEFKSRNQTALKKLSAIEEPLRALGEGDPDEGIHELKERRQAARQLAQYHETLEQEHPDWVELKAEIEAIKKNDGSWTFSDEDVVRIDARIEQVENELRERSTERAELKKDIEGARIEQSVPLIESEIRHIQLRHAELRRRRDRLFLLSNLIKQADQQFRLKHQPEVIRLAGDYLARVTDGRYDRLGMDEATGRLVVFAAGAESGMPVGPPLSQGTIDQIYLSIRLAIIDHLDDGKERLPVFLDEVFVNWDAGRRKNVYGILKKMSESRQVFLFTCHDWQAAESVMELDAREIQLHAAV
ncbi:MAG: AAA family ATPase [Rhodothermales bacterium]|nr:AAA family ATPase [Rhodothermales bacterium]